jgi:hypothetical protein
MLMSMSVVLSLFIGKNGVILMSGNVVMARHVRRRIKRVWDKIPCFTFCTEKFSTNYVHYVVVQEVFKVSDDLVFVFNLSSRNCWYVDFCLVVDGFFWSLGYVDAGIASEGWLARYFGDDDDPFAGVEVLGVG